MSGYLPGWLKKGISAEIKAFPGLVLNAVHLQAPQHPVRARSTLANNTAFLHLLPTGSS